MPQVTTDLLIHYDVVGDGPTVLWHNGGCGDGRMWGLGGYVDGLLGYTHVLVDHRGRGRSEAPPDMAGHHMSCYVGDVLAVLDDFGTERAAFVGYSFGAQVGYAVALAAPGRLTGLVALDSVPDPATSPGEVRADAREVLARGTCEIIEELAASEAEPAPAWMIEHLAATDTLAFAGGIEAEATAPDLWSVATSLDLPVLLVVGAHGDDHTLDLGRSLVATLPRGELLELDVAHLAAFHRTDLTLPAIRSFLGSVSART
jgi:pimeloyl-ACP methyl ester carboxylesterase